MMVPGAGTCGTAAAGGGDVTDSISTGPVQETSAAPAMPATATTPSR